ncbi:MAG: hypothetical protein BWY86_01476 [Candidatus Aminicenantes bacterium ADurb.Bin508]|nr:MAG: hypothetical protein BWY86_01476 [Candidatus Aminicenantes bacterium ADurb.Bin508]
MISSEESSFLKKAFFITLISPLSWLKGYFIITEPIQPPKTMTMEGRFQ